MQVRNPWYGEIELIFDKHFRICATKYYLKIGEHIRYKLSSIIVTETLSDSRCYALHAFKKINQSNFTNFTNAIYLLVLNTTVYYRSLAYVTCFLCCLLLLSASCGALGWGLHNRKWHPRHRSCHAKMQSTKLSLCNKGSAHFLCKVFQ